MGDLWVSYRWVLGGLWVGAVLLLLVGCGAKPTYWAALSPASPVVTAQATPADGATFYYDAAAMEQEGTFLYPYVVQRGDDSWLRLRVERTGTGRFFVNRVTVYVDGKLYPLMIAGKVNRELAFNHEREWIDLYASAADVTMLKDMAFAEECWVEFIGEGGKETLPFPVEQQELILRTLALFERMGNDLGR